MSEMIALSVFLSLALVVVGTVSWIGTRRVSTSTRLQSVTSASTAATVGRQLDEDEESNVLQLAASLVEKLGFWGEGTFQQDRSQEEQEDAAAKLAHAGFRGARAATIYAGSRILGIVVGSALFSCAALVSGRAESHLVGIAIFGAVAGFYAPAMFVRRRFKKRQVEITKALPDCLDMLIICVEAGLGLNAALDRVASERVKIKGDVMGRELKYMTYELQAGVPRDQAFHSLGARNGVDDLQALAAFMVQSEKLGAGLTEALKIYSDELRSRRRQKAQEQANKAAVKLLFPLVFFIFPTMFVVILGPAIMSLKESMSGLVN